MKLIAILGLDNPALMRQLMTYGLISAITNVTTVISLISGSRALIDDRDPTSDFVVFCLSVLIAYHCSRKFIAIFINTAFDRMAEHRHTCLNGVAIGSYETVQRLI